jgi:flavorubredoxin
VTEFVQDAPSLTGTPDPAAVDALAAADGAVTPALVRAVIGSHGWDAEAAADAARRFRPS